MPDLLMTVSIGFQQLKQQQIEKMELKQTRKEERRIKRENERDERQKINTLFLFVLDLLILLLNCSSDFQNFMNGTLIDIKYFQELKQILVELQQEAQTNEFQNQMKLLIEQKQQEMVRLISMVGLQQQVQIKIHLTFLIIIKRLETRRLIWYDEFSQLIIIIKFKRYKKFKTRNDQGQLNKKQLIKLKWLIFSF
ncbi:unnamed protein product [Paramecium sonneborni]|uniref:Uncharacterized protein n=1 Tax=Paramecium sonneborni TaxID=65129 RepID=A0A8S1QG32_9CILI|nr:unnamed protein product [Paramecium sonneborni]